MGTRSRRLRWLVATSAIVLASLAWFVLAPRPAENLAFLDQFGAQRYEVDPFRTTIVVPAANARAAVDVVRSRLGNSKWTHAWVIDRDEEDFTTVDGSTQVVMSLPLDGAHYIDDGPFYTNTPRLTEPGGLKLTLDRNPQPLERQIYRVRGWLGLGDLPERLRGGPYTAIVTVGHRFRTYPTSSGSTSSIPSPGSTGVRKSSLKASRSR